MKAAIAFSFAAIVFSQFAVAQTGTWETKAPMPQPVISAAGVTAGGKLYVIDGSSFAGIAAPQVYNPIADSWSFGTSDPTPRAETAAGLIRNKIFVAEGWVGSDSNVPTTALMIYGPPTNSWTPGASSRIARGGSASAVIGARFYLAGGTAYGNSVQYGQLEIYNAPTNRWFLGASLPIVTEYSAGAAIGGKFYVVGGDLGPFGGVTGAVQIYHPGTNNWSSGASMPTPRTGLAVAVLGGKIYAIGGINGTTEVSTIEVYDPVSNTWTTGPDEPTARYLHVAGVIDSKLYVTGGYNLSGVIDGTLDVFTLRQYLQNDYEGEKTIHEPDPRLPLTTLTTKRASAPNEHKTTYENK